MVHTNILVPLHGVPDRLDTDLARNLRLSAVCLGAGPVLSWPVHETYSGACANVIEAKYVRHSALCK